MKVRKFWLIESVPRLVSSVLIVVLAFGVFLIAPIKKYFQTNDPEPVKISSMLPNWEISKVEYGETGYETGNSLNCIITVETKNGKSDTKYRVSTRSFPCEYEVGDKVDVYPNEYNEISWRYDRIGKPLVQVSIKDFEDKKKHSTIPPVEAKTDGNLGSDYYGIASQKAKEAGLEGVVYAGKLYGEKDFVNIKFNDVTGDEIVKAVETLDSLSIPDDTHLRVEWESDDPGKPSYIAFGETDETDVNIDNIRKIAQIWDEGKSSIARMDYDIHETLGVELDILRDQLGLDEFDQVEPHKLVEDPDEPITVHPVVSFELKDTMAEEGIASLGESIARVAKEISGEEEQPLFVSFGHKGQHVTKFEVTPESYHAIYLFKEILDYADSIKADYPGVGRYHIYTSGTRVTIGADGHTNQNTFKLTAESATRTFISDEHSATEEKDQIAFAEEIGEKYREILMEEFSYSYEARLYLGGDPVA